MNYFGFNREVDCILDWIYTYNNLQLMYFKFKGNEEDLAIYKYRTLPVLEYFSQQCTDIARQITNNFSVLTGIVDELTETCTVASGQAGMTQRELRITEQVNTEESESTEAEIKEMIEKRKRLVESIQKAEEEFAKIVLELPGAFNIMTTTAVDRCTSTLHNVSRFFRKATEKIMKFDIFGFFNTCEKELKEAKDMVVDWFQGVKDDSEDPVSFGEGKTGKDEELAKEMIMYIKVMEIKAAVDFMTQTLLEQGSLKVQKSTIDTVWETEAKLGAKMRALKKGEKYAELESIVTSLLNVCQNILGESKSMSTSEETYNQVLNDLLGAQESLELMSKAMKHKLDSVAPEESKSSTEESPKQSHHRGFMVLERIADERFARGRKLQIHLRRYDSETDNISSLFEVQKETAGLLSQLTAELTELGKALDHMSQAATSLTNVSLNNRYNGYSFIRFNLIDLRHVQTTY